MIKFRRAYNDQASKQTLTAQTRELGMEFSGILGFVYLIVVIYAVLQIAQSSADNGKKAIWIAVVLVIPVAGPIAWYFLGPGGR